MRERRLCQTKFYTASWRSGAGWSPTVFAHESPTRWARFDAENDLYSIALTVARASRRAPGRRPRLRGAGRSWARAAPRHYSDKDVKVTVEWATFNGMRTGKVTIIELIKVQERPSIAKTLEVFAVDKNHFKCKSGDAILEHGDGEKVGMAVLDWIQNPA